MSRGNITEYLARKIHFYNSKIQSARQEKIKDQYPE